MNILNDLWFGVRIWVVLYFIFSVIMGCIVIIYFFRERVKKKYYEVRYPEKLIKVVIHYKSGMFKEYWRLLPEDNYVKMEGKLYNFIDSNITKNTDSYAKKEIKKSIEETKIEIDGKKYMFKDLYSINKRWRSYPEIHYFYNMPNPIFFNVGKHKVDLSSKQLEDFKENDLFSKLLTMETEKRMMMLIMIFIILNLLATGFIIAKMMGWIKVG